MNKKNLASYIAFSDWQIESHSLSQIESEPICGAFVNFVLYVGCIVLKNQGGNVPFWEVFTVWAKINVIIKSFLNV